MPPPLKPEAVDEKRRAIIASARLIASKQGLEAAKMSDIAREARVSKGTLYRFFESKEDLLLAVVLEGQMELVPLFVEKRHSGGAPLERLRAMTEVVVQSLAGAIDRVIVDLQAVGLAARDSTARNRLGDANRTAYDAVHEELRVVIAEGIAAGVLRPDLDADAAAAALVAVRDGVIYRASFDEARQEQARARAVFRVVVDGMMCSTKNA
jgi:AcrR family transcriptional regulator